MRPNKIHPKALLAAALISSIPITANAEEEETDTEDVVVIATKTPKNLSDVGSSVTLLDREAIEKSQKVSVYDLLRQVPGVSLSRNGGLGTVSTLRIRGAESGQTLVLIDGIRVNDLSAPSGEFNFANLTTANIERIEVLRGPQSTLYGSDAIGGVINIITKKGDSPATISGFIEGGSFATFRGGADLGIRQGGLAANLSLTGTRTDGISAADSNNGNTEDDGFQTLSVIGNISYELVETLSVNGFIRYADSRAEFDAFDFGTFSFIDGDGVTETEDFQGAVGLTWSWLDGRGETTARVSWANTDRFDTEGGGPSFASESRNRTIDVLNSFEVKKGATLLVGGQFQANEIFTEVFGDFASTLNGQANINSVFAEAGISPVENLHLTFGVRHDDHETFGGHTTFRITANYRIPGTGTIVRANWGEGFKAPTLFQLFSAFGDPDLLPEDSSGWEVGVEQQIIKDNTSLSVTWFKRTTKNQIDFSFDTFTFGNIAMTQASGVELLFSSQPLKTLRFEGNYTHINTSDANTGMTLVRRPKNLANAQVIYAPPGKFSFSAGLNYTGKQLDGGVFLDAFTVVDLRITYELFEHLTLFGRIENALDEDYQEVLGFGTAGVSGYAGVRGSF